jgi:hypothetical protein
MARARFRQQQLIVTQLLTLCLSVILLSPSLVAQKVFTVDGLSGKLSPLFSSKQLVFYPGDVVTVRIIKANLLFYSYRVVLNSEQKLVQSYNVVGVGHLPEKGPNQPLGPPAKTPYASYEGFGNLFKTIGELQDELRRRQDALMRFYENPSLVVKDDGSWSDLLIAQVKSWPEMSQKLRAKFRDFSYLLDTLYAQYFQIVCRKSPGDSLGAKGSLTLIDTARAHLNQAVNDFNSATSVLMRWSRIVDEHEIPVLSQSFLINDESRRYTVQVKRVQVHDPYLTNVGKEIAANPDTTILATIPFEGHEKSRFNLSVGFSAMYRPNSYSYGIVGMPSSDSTLMYKTQRTGNSQIAMKPLVLLGMYFCSIDNFDQQRSNSSPRNFMLTIGTELSLPVSTYVVGIGYDFPFGLVLGGGITSYNRTVPANGWPEGQQVSAINYSTVQKTLPTETKSALGYYLSVAFRPAIFDALYGLLKSTPWN